MAKPYPPTTSPMVSPSKLLITLPWIRFLTDLAKSSGLLVLGTAAQRAVFNPIVPDGAILIFGESDTGNAYWWNADKTPSAGWESLSGAVAVSPTGALDGDGTPGDPLAVRVDGISVGINGSNELAVIPAGVMPQRMDVVTADPTPAVNDTVWFFDDGGTPPSLSIRWRKAGVTYEFPVGTAI